MIQFIVAYDKNRVIGKNNDLPWKLPADLAYFKKVTMGSTVVMGRKTFESIGKPLPGRKNIVITNQTGYKAEGCEVIHSIDELLHVNSELFIIGGATIFEQALPYAQKLYITYIDEEFEGDTYFPEIDFDNWNLIAEEKGIKDEKNIYDYYFQVYERSKH